MRKLKYREIPEAREELLRSQGGRCALCGEILTDGAVLDHCHRTGHIRGALHRACNSLLGKIENNFRRYGVRKEQLEGMMPRVTQYIFGDHSGNPLHPTHKG